MMGRGCSDDEPAGRLTRENQETNYRTAASTVAWQKMMPRSAYVGRGGWDTLTGKGGLGYYDGKGGLGYYDGKGGLVCSISAIQEWHETTCSPPRPPDPLGGYHQNPRGPPLGDLEPYPSQQKGRPLLRRGRQPRLAASMPFTSSGCTSFGCLLTTHLVMCHVPVPAAAAYSDQPVLKAMQGISPQTSHPLEILHQIGHGGFGVVHQGEGGGPGDGR